MIGDGGCIRGKSAPAFDRIIKVARTIADLEGLADIETPHIAEAINYRTLESECVKKK